MSSTWPSRRRRLLVGSLCAALTGLSLGALPPTTATAAVTDTDPAFEVTAADLRFILKQIKISEAHADDGNLLCPTTTDTSGTCVPDPLLPWGLRTVTGIYNNILPGKGANGSADRPFPRLTGDYAWPGKGAGSGTFDLNGPGPGGDAAVTSTGYRDTDAIDRDPRMISNLIVDQTSGNPAAAAAALDVAGSQQRPDGSLFIPNVAPDEGLSAPFNSWFTLFGQFFDHGLDLVDKGGNGTVFVPLNDDDPLVVGADGQAGTADDLPAGLRFMTLTRATVVGVDADGRQHDNRTTPFVDQNQTYTSHPSHQVFLREYDDATGRPRSTGRLLDGAAGGLVTWAETKQTSRDVLGIALDDLDVLDVPQVVTDLYGQFTPGPDGYPQLVFAPDKAPRDPADPTQLRADCLPDGANVLCEGDPADPVDASDARKTNHAFLDDIAHAATPRAGMTSSAAALLGAHYVTGDGRGNENIGLTAVHHVFHAEHNRVRDDIDRTIQATPSLKAAYESSEPTSWGYGARLFQAARFVTEMEYQHLAFEEFGRTIQPAIDVAVGEGTFHTDIDPAIPAEFAHAVYRFGHSMLTDTIDRRGFGTTDLSLFEGFLNPRAFTMNGAITPDQGAGAIINGMVGQTGNAIDEFVDETLRNKLLGLPLDLAAINLARAREAGVPPLQAVRERFFAQTGDPALAPYTDWHDFSAGLRHPESVLNFIAAYAVDDPVDGAPLTLVQRREQAQALMADDSFMSGSRGLDEIDLWVGGLAERHQPFGGMLGSTFNHVFERTLENLQFGDRFYYLTRTIGMNLLHQLEASSFATLVQRTTAASRVPANIFASQDTNADGADTLYDMDVVVPAWTQFGTAGLPAGLVRTTDGTFRYIGRDHIQLHGRDDVGFEDTADRMRADMGDDSLWGYGGADRIEGQAGNDQHQGGPGNDVLTDSFGDDNLKGGRGNDAVNAGPGIDLALGGPGSDFLAVGEDENEALGGLGNDFTIGGNGLDTFAGNEGDDWLEGGGSADLVQGDNANAFRNDPFGGDDVLAGGSGPDDLDSEGGDDVMLTDSGIDRNEGMLGFDWVTHKGDPNPGNADMDNTVFQPPAVENLLDRFDLVEALSGWQHDDVLRGNSGTGPAASVLPDDECQTLGLPAGCTGQELRDHQLALVDGLAALLGSHATPLRTANAGNDIIIGGAGSDLIEGRGGDDFIDGNAWLDVALVRGATRFDRLGDVQADVFADPQAVDPGTVSISRRIVDEDDAAVDTAVFSAASQEYQVTENADGTLTVAHDAGEGLDGTDTLRNIDRLVFGAGEAVDVEEILNTPADGVVFLSSLAPVQDRALTADTRSVRDVDGIDQATMRITWERQVPAVGGGTPSYVALGEGPSLTPNATLVGARLRAVATFTDGRGVQERVFSEVTQPVATAPAPGPAPGPGPAPQPAPQPTANTPVQGSLLVASAGTGRYTVGTGGLADPDGLGAPSFQWQFETGGQFVDLAGGGTQVLTVPDGLRGLRIRARVSYVDGRGHPESIVSAAVRVPTSVAGAPPVTKALSGSRGGRSTAKVVWGDPAYSGGLRISGYKVTAVKVLRGGKAGAKRSDTVGAGRRSLTMRLPTGRYRFVVRALNDHGAGLPGRSPVVRAR